MPGRADGTSSKAAQPGKNEFQVLQKCHTHSPDIWFLSGPMRVVRFRDGSRRTREDARMRKASRISMPMHMKVREDLRAGISATAYRLAIYIFINVLIARFNFDSSYRP